MKSFAGMLMAAIFFLSVLITSFSALAVSAPFYSYEYEKNGTYSEFGRKEVDGVTGAVIEYLGGKSESLYYEAGGSNIFTQRETAHMADVRGLFQFFGSMRNWMLAAFALIAIAVRRELRAVSRCFAVWLIFIVAGFTAFAAAAAMNYEYFFTLFHEVFFTNDYWLLDPADSIIINTMPISFFSDAALIIFLSTLSACALAALAAHRLGKTQAAQTNSHIKDLLT